MIHNKRGIIIVTLTDVEIWVNVLVDFFVRVWLLAPQKRPLQAKKKLGVYFGVKIEVSPNIWLMTNYTDKHKIGDT